MVEGYESSSPGQWPDGETGVGPPFQNLCGKAPRGSPELDNVEARGGCLKLGVLFGKVIRMAHYSMHFVFGLQADLEQPHMKAEVARSLCPVETSLIKALTRSRL